MITSMKKSSKFLAVLCLIFFANTEYFAKPKPITDLQPTVILISIDGFRYDYLDIHRPKTLRKLAKQGVRVKWMTPSFPTKTFPNHYTIATGLLPAHHGITTNNMYDPVFDAVFKMSKREEVQNPRWWQGEPIWVTAEKQGQIAAAYFFPGTETKIKGSQPTYWKKYDGNIRNKKRVDAILKWLDLPVKKRPTMLTLYFSDVDDAGHGFSPRSKKTGKAVRKVDKMIKRLVKGLKKRKISNKVNLIVVSDHGMARVDQKNSIIIDEMFDANMAKQVFLISEIVQIFPKKGFENAIYESIKSKLPPQAKIYRKNELPKRYRYNNNRRIAPLLVLPASGWRLLTRERLNEIKNIQKLKGSHGYDNLDKSMRALFIGHGEAFKKGYVSEPFQNIEVYNLMCKILGLKPAKNDGNFENIKGLLKK